MMRLCRTCGKAIAFGQRECAQHRTRSNARRRNPLYSTREWIRLSQRIIGRHVGEYGWVCPGVQSEGHAPHPSRSLTLDHIVALSAGGEAMNPTNLRVLCRSFNSSLGAKITNARRGRVGRELTATGSVQGRDWQIRTPTTNPEAL